MHPDGRSIRLAEESTNAELLKRLRSANGHLQAVIAMVEVGEPCESVLHQLSAVQAALRCAGQVLIQCQLEQSTLSFLSESDTETRAQMALRLAKLYSLFIKTQTYR